MADNPPIPPGSDSPDEAAKKPAAKVVVLSSVAKAPPSAEAASFDGSESEKPKRLPPPLPRISSTADLVRPISSTVRPGGTTTVIKLPPKTGPLPQLTSLVPVDQPGPDAQKQAPPPLASAKAPKPAEGKRPPPIKLGQTSPLVGHESIFEPKPEPAKELPPVGWKHLEAGELPTSSGLQGLEFFSRTDQPAEEGPFIAAKDEKPALKSPPPLEDARREEATPIPIDPKPEVTFKVLPPPLPSAALEKSPALPTEPSVTPEAKVKILPPPLTRLEPAKIDSAKVEAPADSKPILLPPPLSMKTAPTESKVAEPEPKPSLLPTPKVQGPVLTKPEGKLEPIVAPAEAPPARRRMIPLFLFPPAKRRTLPPVDRSKVQPTSSPTIKVASATPAIELRPAAAKALPSGPRTPTRVPGAPAKAPGSTAAARLSPTPAAPVTPAVPMTTISTAAASAAPVFERKLSAPQRPTTVPGAPAKAPGSTAAATPAAFLKPAVTVPASPAAVPPATAKTQAGPAPAVPPSSPGTSGPFLAKPLTSPAPSPVVPAALPVAVIPVVEKKEVVPPKLPPTSATVPAAETRTGKPPPLPGAVPANTPAVAEGAAAAVIATAAVAAPWAAAKAEPSLAPEPIPSTKFKTSSRLELPERKVLAKPKEDFHGVPVEPVPAAAITGPITAANKKTRSLTVKARAPLHRTAQPIGVTPADASVVSTPQAARAARLRKKRLIEWVAFWLIFLLLVLPILTWAAFHFSQETRIEGQVVPPAGCTLGNEIWVVSDFTEQAHGEADDLARDRTPKLQEIQEDQDHVQRAAADVSARDERIRLLQEQIQASKDEIISTIKQAHDAAQQVWDGPGAQLDAEYKEKLDALQATIADRAAALHLKYSPDPTYASPEVWANAFRLALYETPPGVDSTKEHAWLEDQMKAWRAFTKDVDTRETALREQAAQIKMSPTTKVADLNSRIDDLQHRIDSTITEAEPLKAELQQARADLAQAQTVEGGLDQKYYRLLYALPESVVINGGRLPLLPNGRFSWRHIEKDNAFAVGEPEHHYWIFSRAIRADGRQFWSLNYLVVPKDRAKAISILPSSFVSTKAILRPELSPDEQAN